MHLTQVHSSNKNFIFASLTFSLSEAPEGFLRTVEWWFPNLPARLCRNHYCPEPSDLSREKYILSSFCSIQPEPEEPRLPFPRLLCPFVCNVRFWFLSLEMA